ncbi:fibrinogen gamma chain [Drosophila willistoni]|uniref:fibrinogen gamma chain n=1 Tax=Drosophila willistoni TaxID=7260 RepID=UPI001F07E6B0|nr:fibrinogen gamma chain [Drosophila willistoni]
MKILFRIILLFLLAKHCQQTPVVETTEDFDEEFIETTTQAHNVEKTKDEIIADLQNKLNNMRRHVAAFKSKSQADTAKVLSLSDLIVAYESQIDSNTAIIEKQEEHIKKLNSSVSSYRSIFMQKELEITDLQIKTREDKTSIQDYLQQISNYEDQLKTSQVSSCVPFGNSTGIHLLHLPSGKPFFVPCESRNTNFGTGWTVIQRRLDGSVNFYRDWNQYREGFGELSSEFFIGLDKLYRMTTNERYELLIHFQFFGSEESNYIRYSNFSIGNETEKYVLKYLGVVTCDNGFKFEGYTNYGYVLGCHDPMENNIGMKFTTYDQDNDNFYWQNCAKECHGAWWFNSCSLIGNGFSHLNGLYGKSEASSNIYFRNSVRYAEMLIRPFNHH